MAEYQHHHDRKKEKGGDLLQLLFLVLCFVVLCFVDSKSYLLRQT